MVIHAVFENGVFRPTEPVGLPESCEVKLVVNRETRGYSQASSAAPLAKLAAIATGHPENPNLPTDLAEQHDHYLYGAEAFMIFVDTGYLLAVLNPRDELFERAQRWAATIEERLITTEYNLWELVNSFSDPVDRPKVHAATAEILSSESWELVYATPQLFSEGLTFHGLRTDKHWSLTDCVSFIIMQQRGIGRALAHDHHFEQAGFEALLRRDPP